MRIAIAAEEKKGLDSQVSHHFGRCPYYALVNLDGTEIQEIQVVENPYFKAHRPGRVPAFIQSQGAEVMISGGMGRRALAFFEEYGIKTATGASGSVQAAIDQYLQGGLSGAEPCRQSVEHGHGHEHEHGHGHGHKRGRSEHSHEDPDTPGRAG